MSPNGSGEGGRLSARISQPPPGRSLGAQFLPRPKVRRAWSGLVVCGWLVLLGIVLSTLSAQFSDPTPAARAAAVATRRRGSRDEIVPRGGRTLVVGIVARISGCQNQKELSLDDQVDHAKEVVTDLYGGPVEYVIISTTGKGEGLDRPELDEIERLLRSRRLDLLVVEDLGRLVRGVEAAWLCMIAVDNGVRVLSANDGTDTADDTWEGDVLEACAEHVGHNAHTSRRLKHKLVS